MYLPTHTFSQHAAPGWTRALCTHDCQACFLSCSGSSQVSLTQNPLPGPASEGKMYGMPWMVHFWTSGVFTFWPRGQLLPKKKPCVNRLFLCLTLALCALWSICIYFLCLLYGSLSGSWEVSLQVFTVVGVGRPRCFNFHRIFISKKRERPLLLDGWLSHPGELCPDFLPRFCSQISANSREMLKKN